MIFHPSIVYRSVYIHWPFCPYKCTFCPFVAIAGQDQFMQQYHNALIAEIKLGTQNAPKQSLDTIFIGGGTPSTYPSNLLLDTFGILKDSYQIMPDSEITIEVNPGTVVPEQLLVWKEIGINRLSIGVQSLKDKALKDLNRLQTVEQVGELITQASQLFDNLSIDLILGLPGVSADEWKEYVHTVMQWPISHISIYFLTIHENTQLYFKVKKNSVQLPGDSEMIDLYYWTIDCLKQYGFDQYEISNFARPGRESRHNTAYWERKTYNAFGLGACSFDGATRFANEKNLMKYMQLCSEGKSVHIFSEDLTREQVRLEKVMLGLRRICGISMHELIDGLSENQMRELHRKMDIMHEQGLIRVIDEQLQLTAKGLALENEIVVQLT